MLTPLFLALSLALPAPAPTPDRVTAAMTIPELERIEARIGWHLYWDREYPEYQHQKPAGWRSGREAARAAIRAELKRRQGTSDGR